MSSSVLNFAFKLKKNERYLWGCGAVSASHLHHAASSQSVPACDADVTSSPKASLPNGPENFITDGSEFKRQITRIGPEVQRTVSRQPGIRNPWMSGREHSLLGWQMATLCTRRRRDVDFRKDTRVEHIFTGPSRIQIRCSHVHQHKS